MDGRRLRSMSVGLGLVLMVMLGGIVALVMSESPAAVVTTPSPTASPSPDGSPSPDPSPSPSPEPPASPSPPVEPTAISSPLGGTSPSPEASPTAAVAPTSEPTPTTTTAPTRELTFVGLGLDSSHNPDEDVTPRFFTFAVEGPGRISAQFSDATGRVRACLWRGDTQIVADQSCQNLRRGAVERDVAAGGAELWTLSLIGSEAGSSPSLTLRLRFPTNEAGIRLEGFRFQGTGIDNYNGFEAEIRVAAAGRVRVAALFDDDEGGAHPYRLIVEEIGGGPAQPFLDEGIADALDAETEVATERSYRITLENTQRVAEQRILLSADLAWP